jgi:hypothetical protein
MAIAKKARKPEQALPVVEICYHVDGRFWVRVNRKIKLESVARARTGFVAHTNGNIITTPVAGHEVPVFVIAALGQALYRQLKTTVEGAGKILQTAKIIVFDHPNFVRPWQEA